MTDQEKIRAIRKEFNAVKEYDSLDEAIVTLNRIGAILNEGESQKDDEPYSNREYCPQCGERLRQGDGNYNYDDGCIDYSCPSCDWEGRNPVTEDSIISDLEDRLGDYDLGGIEIKDEDAHNVMKLLEEGYHYEDALEEVLDGIASVLI